MIRRILSSIFKKKKSADLIIKEEPGILLAKASAAEPKSKKAQDKSVEAVRVDFGELEQAYISDSIMFNSINKAVQMILSAGFELQAENQEVLDYFNEFLSHIGEVGEDITWEELLEAIFQHQMIYGNCFVEIVYNKTETQVKDLCLIDPKTIDFARDSMNRVVLDKNNKPVGYVQKIPYGVTAVGDPWPKSVSRLQNGIFLKANRIAHFKLYTYGNRFLGVGLIEPAYKSIVRKKNIEEAQTNSIYARGTFPIIDYVGDESRIPTPQQLEEAAKNLSKLKHNRYIAVPFWHRIEPLEIKGSDIVADTLKYLRLDQCAAAGIPLAIATSSGEATNRATLKSQQKLLEFTLNDIIKKTCATIEKYIFSKISNLKGFKEVPKIKWGALSKEELNEKAQRIVKYVSTGILSPEEARDYILRLENLK